MPAMPSDDGLTISQAINPNDHGPYVSVAAALLFTCSLLFYLFRLYTRWPIQWPFELDDATTTIATVLSLGQFIATLYAVDNGAGKHAADLSPAHQESFYKALYSSNLLYVSCLCFSKLAVALLVQRLTRIKNHVLSTKVISAIIVVWGIVGIVLAAIPCDGALPWNNFNLTCSNLYTRWIIFFVFGVVIETSLLILPVYLIWGVQITLSTKLVVVAAFWFRLPVLVFSILRILALNQLTSSADYPFDIVATEVFTQLEMYLSLISATIPCMRPFLKAFDTGYLGTTVAQVDPTATSTKGSKGSLYILQSKSSGGRPSDQTYTEPRTVDVPMYRLHPEPVEHTARIEHIDFSGNRGDGGSLTTNASDEMIIRKTVDYRVESATR